MNKFLKLIAFLIVTMNLNASGTDLKNNASSVEALIKQQKYDTAFKQLQTEDPNNNNAEIVYNKTYLAMNYYAKCIEREMFAFKDLTNEENITTVREGTGSFNMYNFDIENVLLNTLKKNKTNGKLNRILGQYYFSGFCNLSAEKQKLAESYYLEAIKYKDVDYKLYHDMGVIALERDDVKKAITFLEKSLTLNKEYAGTHYNLAYSYTKLKDFKQAAQNAALAFEEYTDEKLKSEAALLASFNYLDQKDTKNALKYAVLANQHKHMNYYYILGKLMGIYAEMNEIELLNQTADDFFQIQPDNSQLPQDILNIMINAKMDDNLINFFKRNLSKYKKDPDASANLYFHLANYYSNNRKDMKKAKDNYILAKNEFQKSQKDVSGVIKMIDDELSKIK